MNPAVTKVRKRKIQLCTGAISKIARVKASALGTKKRRKPKRLKFHPFFDSREWLEAREYVFKIYGRVCMACGDDSAVMHVDHIKPRSLYPELAFEFDNLQVLCAQCNIKKSNKHETDYRPK